MHLLKVLRLAAGLTTSELAERAGVQVSVISRLECGRQKRAHVRNIHKLHQALSDALQERRQAAPDIMAFVRACG